MPKWRELIGKLPFHEPNVWKIKYEKDGSHDHKTDRLKLYLPQVAGNRSHTTEGVTTADVYAEIVRDDPAQPPFVQLALSPRQSVDGLNKRLEEHGMSSEKWPITYTPPEWHMQKPWHAILRSEETWKKNKHSTPALLLPFRIEFTDSDPSSPAKKQSRRLSANDLIPVLHEVGFLTDNTKEALQIALEEVGKYPIGELHSADLIDCLNAVYAEQAKQAPAVQLR